MQLANEALTASSMLLAKSGADELVEEVFLNFPLVFTGLCVGAFIVQYIQKAKPLASVADALDGLGFPYQLVAVPAIAVGFAVLGKVGVLGGASGLLAKGLLDGWNVFANLALPGAILRY